MAGVVGTFLKLFISRMAAVSFVGLSEDALDSVNYLEEVIGLAADLSFGFLLDNLLVDDFEGQIELVYDVALDDHVEGHVLTHLSDFLSDPFMECADGVALEIVGLDFSNRKVDVFYRSSFILFLFLHFFLWNLKPNDEIGPLWGQDFIYVFKVKIFLGAVIAFKTEHKFSFLFD
jgi:hypothetical protein